MTTIEELQSILDADFGGVLRACKHSPGDGECCINELVSIYLDDNWTDNPYKIRCIDLRPLNDAEWSTDELRTEWMLKVYSVWEHSLDWPEDVLLRRVQRLVIETVRQIISQLPNLPDDIREQCRLATTLEQAQVAAYAAYAASAAAYPAYAAADAAAYAADAAAYAAYAASAARVAERTDNILVTACRIWIEAAEQ